jgi:ribonucleoside-diphosphate reductase alpha chain
MMEHISYYLIKASIKLASEVGSCRKRTRYHDGWMPFDDSPLTLPKTLDWDSLREEAKKHGIRNATLMAFMPSETSSILSNETNGIEPPKSLVTSKGSKDGILNQLVPEYAALNHRYETLWDVKASDYIRTLAVFQHYMDQAISANTSYDPSKCPLTPDGKIKISHLASDFLLAYKMGLKTLYYNNIRDDVDVESSEDVGCASGSCTI